MTHICITNITTIGSDYGSYPGRHQTTTWTSAGISWSRTLGSNFSEILSEIRPFLFKKMKMSSAKWRSFCRSLNVLIGILQTNCSDRNINIFIKAIAFENAVYNTKCRLSCFRLIVLRNPTQRGMSVSILMMFNTLRPRKKAAISQTTFANVFPWMKVCEVRFRFHESLFVKV